VSRVSSDWVRELQQELAEFAAERDWEPYHTPRNLSALVASEAGELLALFRWDQDALAERPADVRHELADVLLGVLRFADIAGIDLESAAREKLALNAVKYPVGKSGPDSA
jgi:dCTP diphosphatase